MTKKRGMSVRGTPSATIHMKIRRAGQEELEDLPSAEAKVVSTPADWDWDKIAEGSADLTQRIVDGEL